MEIIIPQDLTEITLRQFIQFKSLDHENSDDIFIAKKMISIFCNVDINLLNNFSQKDFQEITNILIGMLNSECEFKQRFNYNGIEYGFIPNLENISLGEYIDIDNSFKDNDMNSFLQVVYRPITNKLKDKYQIKPYDVNDLVDMLDVPYSYYKGAEVFFWNLRKDLLNAMKNYLLTQAVEVRKAQKNMQSSVLSGDGISQLSNSLEEISQDLERLQELKLIQPLRIYAT